MVTFGRLLAKMQLAVYSEPNPAQIFEFSAYKM